jgi:hypothetical protein
MAMTEQVQPPAFQPGQIVNGHVWTGTEWLPIAQPTAIPKVKSTWVILAGVVCLVVAGLAGVQALSWLVSFSNLDSEGNQFAGILALLGMGAGVVAAGFGVAGVLLLKK